MTTKIREFASSLPFILIATAIVSGITFAIGRHYALNRDEWPGWVQAVGSVEAILVAVWVAWQQAESQRRRDEEKERAELRGMLQSLRSEMEASLEFAQTEIGAFLNNTQFGTAFRYTYPITEDPFPIFSGYIPKLGMIADDQLRHQVVITYASARSFVLTIVHHNKLVAAFDVASAKAAEIPHPITLNDAKRCEMVLAAYSDTLRDAYKRIESQAAAMIEALRNA